MSTLELVETDNTLADLKNFSEAQQKVIIQLNRKIQKLELERNSLKEMVEKAPVHLFSGNIEVNQDVSTEKAICLMQINILKSSSMGRELTYEEAKKLEIYNKILNGNQDKKDPIDVKTRKYKDEELESMLEIKKPDGK